MLYENIPVREVRTDALRGYERRVQGRFLKGPIPLQPIALAAQLPGQALAVYLAIHHRAALTRNDTVTLPKGLMEQFGVSRDAKARSLRLLEDASLISVERRKGLAARITLGSFAKPAA